MKNDFYFKETKLALPIYGYRIYVSVTDNLSKALEKKKITYPDIVQTRALHFAEKDVATSHLLFQTFANISDIAHESIHAMQRIITWISAGYQDREFVAYLGGYIIENVADIVYHWQDDYKEIIKISQNEKKTLTKKKK